MKTVGQDINSSASRMTRILSQDDMDNIKALKCVCDVHMEQAYIMHLSEEENYRPVLKLIGKVQRIKGDFPCNVDCIDFGSDMTKYPSVNYVYNFTDEELSALALKGLFTKGFTIPEEFTNNDFEDMPVNVDLSVLRPVYEGDVPVMFAGICNPFNIETSSEDCGYTLVDYFEQAEKVEDEPEIDEYDDYIQKDEQAEKDEVEKSEEKEVLESQVDTEPVSEDKEISDMYANIEKRVNENLGDEPNVPIANKPVVTEKPVIPEPLFIEDEDEQDDEYI